MKYLMMIYGNDEVWGAFSPEDFEALVAWSHWPSRTGRAGTRCSRQRVSS